MRKIIQISGDVDKAWCLCDDGTVWQYVNGTWMRFIGDIPQDENKTNEIVKWLKEVIDHDGFKSLMDTRKAVELINKAE